MLKRSLRLPAKIRLSGTLHLTNPLFTIRYAKSGFEESRFVFIVSKRVSSKAVVRNRIKRQISEGVRNLLPSIKLGYNFIFSVKKEAQFKTTAEIYKEIEASLKKAEFI